MIDVIFESHATTVDNEAGIASGWYDAQLSSRGEREAEELGKRYNSDLPEAVFCADRQRGYRTAQIAFPDLVSTQLFMDWRLRECNYGDWEHTDNKALAAEKINRITESFPNGESYLQALERMRNFLNDLRQQRFERVLIIGSRATHYGLEHWINGIKTEELLTEPMIWQPGWQYKLR